MRAPAGVRETAQAVEALLRDLGHDPAVTVQPSGTECTLVVTGIRP